MEKVLFDIGLVYRSNHNYGANLTHFALARTLLSYGKKVLLIDMPKGLDLSLPLDRDDPFELFEKQPYIPIENLENINQEHISDNGIYVWRAKNVWDIEEANKICEMFLVGSDQLWRNYFLKGSAYYSLLGFAEPNKFCASYATSFGVDIFEGNDEEKKEVGVFLKRFNRISTREKSGMDIVNDLAAKKAKWVIDPVFLLDETDYKQLIRHNKVIVSSKTTTRIGFYFLDYSDRKCDFILKQIEISQCSCAGYSDAMVEEKSDNPLHNYILNVRTVENWLRTIDESDIFITDSFHGMCFSIILHKPFIVISNPNAHRGYPRIYELLSRIGLDHHIVSEEALSQLSIDDYKYINYEEVDKYLSVFIEESREWLKETIYESLNGYYCDNSSAYLAWKKYANKEYSIYKRNSEAIQSILQSHCFENREYILWGTGKKFRELFSVIEEILTPLCVIDNNPAKWGKFFGGFLECKKPQAMQEYKNCVVIILIENPEIVNSIVNQLLCFGVKDYITYEEIINV